MVRYSTYWRWIPVRMIQEYSRLKKDTSKQAEIFREAIERAINETEQLPDGKLRIRAVQLVYLKKTHTMEGAAMKIYVSRSTVRNWLYDFVDLVALYAGFKEEKVCASSTEKKNKMRMD